MEIRLKAYAKINLTLEVLGRRADGYHEVRTVLQTIDLADEVTLVSRDLVTLEMLPREVGPQSTIWPCVRRTCCAGGLGTRTACISG